MKLTEALSADFIDQQYRLWKADPEKLSADWRFYFEGFELALKAAPKSLPVSETVTDDDQSIRQARVEAMKYRYRDLGHLLACLDPLMACPTDHPLLNLDAFDLSPEDLDREFFTRRFSNNGPKTSLREIQKALRETYCHSIGIEFMHLQDPEERNWLRDHMEPVRNQPQLDAAAKRRILELLYKSGLFESFLHKKYIGQTRFSLEGAEAIIPMLDTVLNRAGDHGCREIILGTAHRGRLNVQANILQKPYEELFREFESCYNPEDTVGAGDVKYHNGYLADLKTAHQHPMRVFLVNNPSHLESVNPVVEGLARARMDMMGGSFQQMMPILFHGDAAFAGQGIVMETLNMSQLEGYRTGGTLHVIINNQIGYTTLPEDARSTRYSTDVAKMLMVPIFHVHGENPEALVHVAQLACDYRYAFQKDVVIDVICYRRYGHNEGDEPYFTQPQMYERIKQRPPVYQIYKDTLVAEKLITEEEVNHLTKPIQDALDQAYKAARDETCTFPMYPFYEEWDGVSGTYSHEPVDTSVSKDRLLPLASKLNIMPEGFTLHPKLKRLFGKRLEAVQKGDGIDWANAEALAFGSLLEEGVPLRLSGQDCRRGTFSQRHCYVIDTKTGALYSPFHHLSDQQIPFQAFNSLLSEAGVLGFEYGYSLAQPNGIVFWEAQFGDFANNAQGVIDLYIASGQDKWQRLSGLVLLLPHGLEGLGPEHSSARLERFLLLCANDNMQVCNATTPAQYFHLLRRQVKRAFRKPLILMTPKSLLRHPLAVSKLTEFTSGHFQEVLDDPGSPKKTRRVLFCSGKLYYQLFERRQALNEFDIAIVRVEQFYPFPEKLLKAVIKSYRQVKDWCWVQEEPANMGGWQFIRPRLEALLGNPLKYIGRPAAASPATGFANIYKQQQAAIVHEAVGPPERQAGRSASG